MRTTFHKRGALLFLALALLSACRSADKPVARVGDFTISQRDVEYREQVIAQMYPEAREKYGYRQLEQAYLTAQILANNGHRITPEIIDKEIARIDKNTQMPELLEKIKAVFGSDTEAYRRVYILPVYAQRTVFFDFFLHHPEIQRKSLEKPRAFLKDATSPGANLPQLAKQYGVKLHKAEISPTDGLQIFPKHGEEKPVEGLPESVRNRLQTQRIEAAKTWFEEFRAKTPPGKLFPDVVDFNETWLVVRHVGPKPDGNHAVEMFEFPKADYNEWLEAEKKKVPVQKFD